MMEKRLLRDEVVIALDELGEDVELQRVERLCAVIDAAVLPTGELRARAVRDAVDAARKRLDAAATGEAVAQPTTDGAVPAGATHFTVNQVARVTFLRREVSGQRTSYSELVDGHWRPMDVQPSALGLSPRTVAEYLEGTRPVKTGLKYDKPCFNLRYPYVLKHYTPHAAAVPGTDMGEQSAGDRYWLQTGGWGWDWRRDAKRHNREVADLERARLIEAGCRGVEIVDANILEARLHVMRAARRQVDESLPREEYRAQVRALANRIEAIPDECFARAVPDLASRSELTEPGILLLCDLNASRPQPELSASLDL